MAKKSAKQTLFDQLKSVSEIEFLGYYYRSKQLGGWWRHTVEVKYKGHDCLYVVQFTPDNTEHQLHAMRHDRSAINPKSYESYFGENRFNQFYDGQFDGFAQWVKDTWDSKSMSVRPDSFEDLTGGSSIGFNLSDNILV